MTKKASLVIPVCVSAVLPGCGHIAVGQHGKGLLLFFLFGFAVDGVLYGHAQFFLRPEQGSSALYVLALILWLGLGAYAVTDTVRLALRSRRVEAGTEAADAHIRQALVAYLADDLGAAETAARAALRANPNDADALFYLGVVYAQTGRRRLARRAFGRCLRCDADGKWEDEVEARLQALDAAPTGATSDASPSSPPAPGGSP